MEELLRAGGQSVRSMWCKRRTVSAVQGTACTPTMMRYSSAGHTEVGLAKGIKGKKAICASQNYSREVRPTKK